MADHRGSSAEEPAGQDTEALGAQQEERDSVVGQSVSADGLIRATVGSQARLDHLELSPEILRQGPDGPAMDAGTLAEAVRTTVNAAMDDLHDKLSVNSGGSFGMMDELDELTSSFERALDQVADDIARAQKRLES